MAILPLVLLFATLSQASGQQTPASPAPQAHAAPAPEVSKGTPEPPSAVLQPAIDALRVMLGQVRLDKWKSSNPVRDTADANLQSIRRDLDTTLPPLLQTADGTPSLVTSLLPVFRNVNALYDVLLRVAGSAEQAAPRPQTDSLKQALTTLDQSRRSLGDRLQSAAASQEQQVADLQAQLRAVPVAAPTRAPVPPVVTKAKPRKKKTAPPS